MSRTIRSVSHMACLAFQSCKGGQFDERGNKGFAHPERIQNIVKNYSQFVSFPIYMWQEKGFTKEVEVDEEPFEMAKEEENADAESLLCIINLQRYEGQESDAHVHQGGYPGPATHSESLEWSLEMDHLFQHGLTMSRGLVTM